MISFRGFLTQKLALIEDAVAYYDHFNFFTDQIRRGVYPMWEPTMNHGAPIEFFMRRIGSYNPFISLILLFNLLGLSYGHAYMLFLAVYFFIGMMGFYLVARKLFGQDVYAFFSFILLLFSSLGTRLFDSYFLLVFIPMTWFFYFLYQFSERPRLVFFWGILFTLMILFSTYVPFYFLLIVIIFFITYVAFYTAQCREIVLKYKNFITSHKKWALLWLIIFMISLVPAVSFYKETKRGEIIMPMRNAMAKASSPQANIIEVGAKTVKEWAIEEDLAFSEYFSNYRDMKFAILYVPVIVYILFLCGLVTKITKKMVFLCVWGLLLYVLSSPNAPFYDFLYQHVVMFKYFRNIHFFLWIILLPLFVLILVEEFRVLLESLNAQALRKKYLFVYIGLVHAVVLGLVMLRSDAIVTTYLAIGFSFLFFWLYTEGRIDWNKKLFAALCVLLLAVVIQPLEVFYYLEKNSVKQTWRNLYDAPYNYYRILTEQKLREFDSLKSKITAPGFVHTQQKESNVYYGLKSMDFLDSHLDGDTLDYYVSRGDFILYDRIESLDDRDVDFEKLGDYFAHDRNSAFISSEDPIEIPPGISKNISAESELITRDSDQLKVIKFDVNELTIKTNFKATKFLVYNTGFHSGWQAYLDGKRVHIYRANIAFKGLWVPAGEHTIYLRYQSYGRYFLNFSLLFVFYLTFVMFIYFLFKERRERRLKYQ